MNSKLRRGASDRGPETFRLKNKNPVENHPMTTFHTSREIPTTIEQIFAAISSPNRLSRWWGPAGFTNTFNVCEFKKGGRWSFVMHGPDGKDYPNDSLFAEIEPLKKVVVDHVSEPKFSLTIALEPSGKGTLVSWTQTFGNADMAERIRHICIPANEQNLDRLTDEVLGKRVG